MRLNWNTNWVKWRKCYTFSTRFHKILSDKSNTFFSAFIKNCISNLIYREENELRPFNSRSISILPVLGKSPEFLAIILLLICRVFHSTTCQSQFRFRPKRSTADAIASLAEEIKFDWDKQVEINQYGFLDLKKNVQYWQSQALLEQMF